MRPPTGGRAREVRTDPYVGDRSLHTPAARRSGRRQLVGGAAFGDEPLPVGPREACDAPVYALRIAPDSALLIGDAAHAPDDADGTVCSALGDGIICIDVTGPAAASLMSLGSEHRFDDPPGGPLESARMLFAGLPVAVMRCGDGWRLHAERPWAPALWHWLAGHVAHCGEGAV